MKQTRWNKVEAVAITAAISPTGGVARLTPDLAREVGDAEGDISADGGVLVAALSLTGRTQGRKARHFVVHLRAKKRSGVRQRRRGSTMPDFSKQNKSEGSGGEERTKYPLCVVLVRDRAGCASLRLRVPAQKRERKKPTMASRSRISWANFSLSRLRACAAIPKTKN